MSSLLVNATLLSSDLNSTISSFIDKNEFIYSGIICKEWTHHETKNTSLKSLLSSESRLKEAIDSGFVPIGKTLTKAIEFGNLECIKQIWSDIGIFRAYDFSGAAEYGNLDNMKWLLTNGCGFDRGTFSFAPNVNLTVLTEPPDLQVTEKKASYKRNREIFRGRDLVHPYRIG